MQLDEHLRNTTSERYFLLQFFTIVHHQTGLSHSLTETFCKILTKIESHTTRTRQRCQRASPQTLALAKKRIVSSQYDTRARERISRFSMQVQTTVGRWRGSQVLATLDRWLFGYATSLSAYAPSARCLLTKFLSNNIRFASSTALHQSPLLESFGESRSASNATKQHSVASTGVFSKSDNADPMGGCVHLDHLSAMLWLELMVQNFLCLHPQEAHESIVGDTTSRFYEQGYNVVQTHWLTFANWSISFRSSSRSFLVLADFIVPEEHNDFS